jgi:hypothetical protein
VKYLIPAEIKENMCIPYNHMTDEEQCAILKEMNIEDIIDLLVYPCTKPECFVRENDPDIEEFIAGIHKRNIAKNKEFADMIEKLQFEGIEYQEAIKQCYKVLYGIDL